MSDQESPTEPLPSAHPVPPGPPPGAVPAAAGGAATAPSAGGPPPWVPDRPVPGAYPYRSPWRRWGIPALIGLLAGLLIGAGGLALSARVWGWGHGDGWRHSRMHDGPFGSHRFGPDGRFGGPRVGTPGYGPGAGQPGVPGASPSAPASPLPS